jgi:hypothetical protein
MRGCARRPPDISTLSPRNGYSRSPDHPENIFETYARSRERVMRNKDAVSLPCAVRLPPLARTHPSETSVVKAVRDIVSARTTSESLLPGLVDVAPSLPGS